MYCRVEPRFTFTQVRQAAVALAREVERRAPDVATSRWWKEERHGVFVDYNQNAKDRTTSSAYSVRPTPDARVSAPLLWEEVPDCDPAAFTVATMPDRMAMLGDPWEAMDASAGTLEPLLELATEQKRSGLPDAPWPPHFEKQPDEPTRAQPSRQRSASPRREGTVPEAAPGKTSGPTGRRRTTIPLIEIARAASKDEALAGLDRWKARHPDVWPYLEPADVLVDSMRGRSSTWTRVRVNLEHVPEALRPAQEPLDPDYHPWAEFRKPARGGRG